MDAQVVDNASICVHIASSLEASRSWGFFGLFIWLLFFVWSYFFLLGFSELFLRFKLSLSLLLFKTCQRFLDIFFQWWIVLSTAVVNNEYFARSTTDPTQTSEVRFSWPKNLFQCFFIEHEVLLDICTAMSCIINEEEHISDVIVAAAIFDKVWLGSLSFFVPLEQDFFEVFQFILKEYVKTGLILITYLNLISLNCLTAHHNIFELPPLDVADWKCVLVLLLAFYWLINSN